MGTTRVRVLLFLPWFQAVVEADDERREVPIVENGNKIPVTNALVRKWVAPAGASVCVFVFVCVWFVCMCVCAAATTHPPHVRLLVCGLMLSMGSPGSFVRWPASGL